MMQQRHYIDMMLFGEIIPLKYENKVEDNLSTAAQVSTEEEET